MERLLITLVTVMGVINVLRITFYMVGSDIYTVKQKVKVKSRTRKWLTPTVTAVVPAHNEERVIEAAIDSLQASDYPKKRLQIVVVDDGSVDNTAQLIKDKIKQYKLSRGFEIKLSSSKHNKGKATAINHAVKRHATGSIIMCLAADSLVETMTIRNAVQHFRDRRVVALASNVNILENGTLLGLVQRFEFIVSHKMKKAHTTLNAECIIDGVGSYFRRSELDSVNFYDTNTMTEDVDLIMKVVARGNKKQGVAYAADAITYTEPATTYKSLIKQRVCWNRGRFQAFLKNKNVFKTTDDKYSKLLTVLMLPYVLVQGLFFFLEPVFLAFILYSSARYRDVSVFLLAGIIIVGYISLNVWSTQHLRFRSKLRLTLYAPAAYVLSHVLSFVEYVVLLMSFIKLPRLKKSITNKNTSWKTSSSRSTAANKA